MVEKKAKASSLRLSEILCLAALGSFLSKPLKLTENNKQAGLLDMEFRPDTKPLMFLNTQ